MIKIILLIVPLMVLVSSCKESFYCKRCPTQNDTITKTEYKINYVEKIVEKLRDTLITVAIPNNEMLIEALVKCDSLNKAQMEEMTFKNNIQYVRLKVENGKLTQVAKLTRDSLSVRIDYLERTIKQKEQTEKLLSEKIKATKTVPAEIHWWKKMFMWIGIFTVVVVIIIVGFNIYKRLAP